jgi:hypothetical protein
MLRRNVGEHVRLGLVHQPAEFLEPRPQLIGDVPPDLARRLAVGLDEGLADGGSDNRLMGRRKLTLPEHPGCLRIRFHLGHKAMDTTTLLLIVIVVLLLGGGGFYGRGRWW